MNNIVVVKNKTPAMKDVISSDISEATKLRQLNPRGGGGVSRLLKPFSKRAVLFYGFLWTTMFINSDHRYVITLENSDDKIDRIKKLRDNTSGCRQRNRI